MNTHSTPKKHPILPRLTDDQLRRFENYFFKTNPSDPTAPWLWVGPSNEKGYGYLNFGSQRFYAHRVSYELFVGPIPDNMMVCHRNDLPADVNPANLFLGTHRENMADRDAKGRQSRGSGRPSAKLDEAKVVEIRQMYHAGISQTQIARHFGVQQSQISCIMRGKTWTHVK